MGLANVEWVIVDDADVLLDFDSRATTRTFPSVISLARGHSVPVTPSLPTTPIPYPFNVVTIPTITTSLASYRKVHMLPSDSPHRGRNTFPKPCHRAGNKLADIERRTRRGWPEDSSTFHRQARAPPEGALIVKQER